MKTPTRQSHRKASRRGEVKARLMWQTELSTTKGMFPVIHYDQCLDARPVFVLPADAESVERMREQAAKASDEYFDSINGNYEAFKAPDHAAAILKALNLTHTKP